MSLYIPPYVQPARAPSPIPQSSTPTSFAELGLPRKQSLPVCVTHPSSPNCLILESRIREWLTSAHPLRRRPCLPTPRRPLWTSPLSRWLRSLLVQHTLLGHFPLSLPSPRTWATPELLIVIRSVVITKRPGSHCYHRLNVRQHSRHTLDRCHRMMRYLGNRPNGWKRIAGHPLRGPSQVRGLVTHIGRTHELLIFLRPSFQRHNLMKATRTSFCLLDRRVPQGIFSIHQRLLRMQALARSSAQPPAITKCPHHLIPESHNLKWSQYECPALDLSTNASRILASFWIPIAHQ